MDNKIIAVVVMYNPDIETFIEQHQSLRYQVCNVVYVDNGSDNYNEFFSRLVNAEVSDGYVSIIKNTQNFGLGFAQNQGVEKALELGASHVLILDHDSVLKENFVSALLFAEELLLQKGIPIGAVGPVYVNEKTGEVYPITKYIGPFIKRLKPEASPQKASFLISSGTLIRKCVLDIVGLMNEDLFVDYVDIEWSYRAVHKGFALYAVPSARMSHVVGDARLSVFGRTISVHSPLRRYYLSRNSIHMLRMPYVDLGYKLRELVFNGIRIIIFFIISKQRMLFLKFSLKGFWDGFKGVVGECSINKKST
ncbi:MAG: rhamnosyltransferase [Paludibacter sp.]|nr:rhamnosyltransferase [Paludibacter sp.]